MPRRTTRRKHSWLTTQHGFFAWAWGLDRPSLSYWDAPGAKRLVVADTAVIVKPVEELLGLRVLLVHELPLFVRQKYSMHQFAFNFERDFSEWSLLLDNVLIKWDLVLCRTILLDQRLSFVKSIKVICGNLSPVLVVCSNDFAHSLLVEVHIFASSERNTGHSHFNLLVASIIKVALAHTQNHLHNVGTGSSEFFDL